MELVERFYTEIIPIGLWVAMLGLGLSLTAVDIKSIFASPKALTIGMVGQVLLLPALGFGLAFLLAPTPAVAVGAVILAACPGGLTANAYSFAARADVALSVSLTALSSLVSLLTLPLFTFLALAAFFESSSMPTLSAADIFSKLVTLTILPVAIGMLIRHLWPARSTALIETVRMGTLLFLIFLIGVGTIISLDDLREHFARTFAVAASLNVLSMLMGFGLGALFSLRVPQRVAITFEIGVQNLALASLIAVTLLANREFFIVTLVYGIVMKITAMGFMFAARRWLSRDAAAAQGPATGEIDARLADPHG
jgi:BASS family bile acid:Na+ symporter